MKNIFLMNVFIQKEFKWVFGVFFVCLSFLFANSTFAIGISPPSFQFGKITEQTTQSITIFRNSANDGSAELNVTITPRKYGAAFFSGASSIKIPAGSESANYSFSLKPGFSMMEEVELQLDFFIEKNSSMSGSGSSVQNGTTAILFFQLDVSTSVPDETGKVEMNKESPQVTVTNTTQPITVSIDKNILQPSINFSSLVENGVGVLPQTTIVAENAGNVQISIPASTQIVSDDTSWNGVIEGPYISPVTQIEIQETPGIVKQVLFAIEIGSSDSNLVFSKGVRLFMPNQGGKKIGYVNAQDQFLEIVNTCSSDSQSAADLLEDGGDCKITIGSDIAIWTKHFSLFTSFVDVNTSNSGGVVPLEYVQNIPWSGSKKQDEKKDSTKKETSIKQWIQEKFSDKKESLSNNEQQKNSPDFDSLKIKKVSLLQPSKKKKIVFEELFETKKKKTNSSFFPLSVISTTHPSNEYVSKRLGDFVFSSELLSKPFTLQYLLNQNPIASVNEFNHQININRLSISLREGENILHARVIGENGQSEKISRKVFVDTISPKLLNADLVQKKKLFGFQYETLMSLRILEETSGLKGAEVFLNEKKISTRVKNIPLKKLKKGKSIVRVDMVDNAGNKSSGSFQLTFGKTLSFQIFKK